MRAETLAVRYRSTAGRPLISVTQVLNLAGRIDTTWFTDESRWRGQVVHALTESFDRGDPLEIPSGLEGYIEAYASFKAVVRPVYIDTEVSVWSEELGFAGRIDRVCASVFGEPGILDFKTGGASAWHGLQLAAYNALRPAGARWAVYLGKTGRYRLVPYTDPEDYRRFQYDLARVRGSVLPSGDFWTIAA